VAPAPPQNVAPTQTFLSQQLATAQISPEPHSVESLQSARLEQGVSPSTQKPVDSVVEAHTQVLPGPQGTKVEQVRPVQEEDVQAPFLQEPVEH
jgi:hypothetical protein